MKTQTEIRLKGKTRPSVVVSEKEIYNRGFEAGSRIKAGKWSFNQLLNKYDRIRREFNKRIEKAKLSQHKADIKAFEDLINKIFYIKGLDFPVVSVNKILELKEGLKKI